MKTLVLAAVAAISFGAAAQAANCEIPALPSVDLNPSDASERDVFETYRSVKNFQREVAAYRECLAETGMNSSRLSSLHNASIDQEEELVRDFNQVLTAFRKRQGNAQAR